MSELNAQAVDRFTAAATAGAEEAQAAFARTFDKEVTIENGGSGAAHTDQLAEQVAGKGLVLMLWVGSQGIAILLPHATNLVPDWCEMPDATQKSKLETFAQEWGMNLVPEDFFPESFKSAVLHDVPAGILRGQLDWEAGYLELRITAGDAPAVSAYIIWPLNEPDAMLTEPSAEEDLDPIIAPPTFGGSAPTFDSANEGANLDPFANAGFSPLPGKRKSLDDLPGYSRSVLKVKVPVAAVLARARKPIKSILELGVGSVIQFDKACDELLEVEVGQSVVIGLAEAVKVGDKFGFRIHSILLPEERFRKVEVRREGEYRAHHDSPQIIGKAPIKTLIPD